MGSVIALLITAYLELILILAVLVEWKKYCVLNMGLPIGEQLICHEKGRSFDFFSFFIIFAEHRQFMANIVAIIMIVPEMEPVP